MYNLNRPNLPGNRNQSLQSISFLLFGSHGMFTHPVRLPPSDSDHAWQLYVSRSFRACRGSGAVRLTYLAGDRRRSCGPQNRPNASDYNPKMLSDQHQKKGGRHSFTFYWLFVEL